MPKFLACLLLAVSLPATAQIYEYTDADGNKAFSNQPPDSAVNAQPIDLQPTNGADVPDIPPPAPRPTPMPQADSQSNAPSNEGVHINDEDQDDDADDGYNYYDQPQPVVPLRDRIDRPRVQPLPAGGDAVGVDPGHAPVGTPGRR